MNGKGWKHLFYIVGYLMEPNECFVGLGGGEGSGGEGNFGL
jgi:hypothetical protein